MEGNISEGEKEQAVMEFMDIVGETAERARQYLQATAWGLENAVQLYFAEGNDVGGTNTLQSTAGVPQPGPSEKVPSSAPPLCSGSASAADRDLDEETYVRPPLPIKREALYEDFLQTRAHQILQSPSQPSFVDPFRNFEEEANQQLGEPSSHTAPATGSGTRDSLAALYRPPFVFMFQGTFEQAKMEAARQEKWLLVNVQSTKEFASYMLNRDTWAHEAVKDTVGTSFIFWQVYDDTEEGRKVCTYYKLLSMPTILVIDPITGQKMRAWEGMVSAERLLEDLVRYMDMGPLEKQPNVFPPQKRPREAAKDYSPPMDAGEANLKGADQQWSGVVAPAKDGMGVSDTRHSPTPMEESGSFSSGQAGSDTTAVEVIKPDVYPTLPEEPDAKTPGACRVGIRFPDGSRGHRRFLKTDPIKFLWSFCSSQVQEAAGGRKFHLNQTVPGATRSVDFSSEATLDQAGVANSMLSMTWN